MALDTITLTLLLQVYVCNINYLLVKTSKRMAELDVFPTLLTAWHAKVPLSLSFNDGIFSDGQYIFPSFKMLIDVKTPSPSFTQNTDVTFGTPLTSQKSVMEFDWLR